MTLALQVQPRTKQTDPARLRQAGHIPGVVYGGGRTDTTNFAVDYLTFDRLYEQAGESTLIDLDVAGESAPVKVVIKDVQYDPVKGRIIHVDLKQIKMDEKMEAPVELIFVGEAPAVKEQGGTLTKGKEEVTIKCLPTDLLSEIEVDLRVLATFDDVISVADLKVPATVEIVDDPSALVATVSPPLSEEELAKLEETSEADISAVEVEEKGKKEEAESEGEAAPADAKKAE